MLYWVQMDVRLPHNVDPSHADTLKADEKARGQELQRAGKWIHLWELPDATPISAFST
jgi:muconolactone D-isomerase